MSDSKDWIEKAVIATEWKDVSDETVHNYHWHRSPETEAEYDAGNMSIRMAKENQEPLAGYSSGVTVEIYPFPEFESEKGYEKKWHWSGDCVQSLQSARAKVASLMFRFSDERKEKELSTFSAESVSE